MTGNTRQRLSATLHQYQEKKENGEKRVIGFAV
jgi:hypothetical protein